MSEFEASVPLSPILDRKPHRTEELLMATVAFLVPLKLSLVYIFLIPFLLFSLIRPRVLLHLIHRLPPHGTAFLFFLVVAALSSSFGIAPAHSLIDLAHFVFFSLTIVVFSATSSKAARIEILLALIAGQTVASVHSVLQSVAPASISQLLLGAVTESGQLALVIPCALGLTFSLSRSKELQSPRPPVRRWMLIGMLVFASLTALSQAPRWGLNSPAPFFAALPVLLWVVLASWERRQAFRNLFTPSSDLLFWLLAVALPLLSSALVINLKRGPWLGVLISVSIFLLIYAPRRLLGVCLAVFLVVALVDPVRDRLLHSEDHFFIPGGRSEIWEIGAELAAKYPLGIGYHNSSFLQRFSVDIPHYLEHFHNNFLNILVELGWLGLGVFIWWLVLLLRESFSQRRSGPSGILMAGLGCAIISWQIAGLVEYNVGDSEVWLVAMIVIATIGGLSSIDHA